MADTIPILTRDELDAQLWKAADILRGTSDSSDYKNHIFGLLFLKRLSDVFDERRQAIIDEWTRSGKTRAQAEKIADDPDEYGNGSFFIPERARWSSLMKVGENKAEAIDKALLAIEEENGQYLEGVLAGVRFNDERRFGDAKEIDDLMSRLLTHFSKIPLGNRNLAEPDVLGNAYEYLIERFADSAGKKGGEFYTPRGVVQLIVELLQPTEGMRIHDPTCGSGGMLIECGHYIADHQGNARNITLTGQEKNIGTWSICKLNMLLHNFPDADIRAGDTIRNPKFTEAGTLLKFDRVIANPPFSLDEWGHDVASQDGYHRFQRGIPPRTKGDMAFLQHMVEVANDRGAVGVVMPHGVLFRGGAEKAIRAKLLDEDLFEAVIGLPEKLFYGTGIPAAVLILNKHKPKARKNKVLFIDASSEGFYHQGKNQNRLRDLDILRIGSAFHGYADPTAMEKWMKQAIKLWLDTSKLHTDRQYDLLLQADAGAAQKLLDKANARTAELTSALATARAWLSETPAEGKRPNLEKFAAVVDLSEITGENDYNLNISRYVDPTDPPPVLDVAAELVALRELEKQRDDAEKKMKKLLEGMGYRV